MTGTMREAALELAAVGWPVFPLRGKVPAISKDDGGNGHLDGTCDPVQIAAWWDKRPRANIGARVPDPLFVIDVDPRHLGDHELAALEAAHGPLPATLAVESGRGDGGHHLYLQHPGGSLTSAKLPTGLDLKAGGKGYCVMPPSIHPVSGRPYRWVDPAVPPAVAPAWLIGLLRPERPRTRTFTATPTSRGYGPAAIASEATRVAAAPQGERNETLHLGAFRLGQLAEAGHVDEHDAAAALAEAAAACGLPDIEAANTIKSGLAGGRSKPRRNAQ